MRKRLYMVLCFSFGALFAGAAYASDRDGHEDTLMVVDEGTTPDDIMNVIELPTAAAKGYNASSTARGNATDHSNAADAKAFGKEFGQQVADEAKSNDVGQSIRDEMQQSRRRDARDMSDGRRPENPGRP